MGDRSSKLAVLAVAMCIGALAPAASGFAPAVRVRECGLPPASAAAGPDSFTRLWAASRAGWTGGDSALSARLPAGRVMWLFGDTFIHGAQLVRNSLVVQDGDCLTTFMRGSATRPSEYLPASDDPQQEWLWPNQP